MNMTMQRSGHVGAFFPQTAVLDLLHRAAGEDGAMKLGAVNPVSCRGAPPGGPAVELARSDGVLWMSLGRMVAAIAHAWARRRGREPPEDRWRRVAQNPSRVGCRSLARSA